MPVCRLLSAVLSAALLIPACAALQRFASAADEGDEKPKAPEHNVTLNEEDEVGRLLKKAAQAREKAATDPEAWPDCIKAYSTILEKYPGTVFLYRWEGDGGEKASSWGKGGVYRSTAEKVATELASLPPEALKIYRAVNDSTARSLYRQAEQDLDERKMELVAQTYFSTSLGDSALAWLGERAYDLGSYRQAITQLRRIETLPDADVPKMAAWGRRFLAELKAGLHDQAAETLKQIEDGLKEPANGTLRIGHAEGPEALADLKARLGEAPKAEDRQQAAGGAWETFYGNAAHDQAVAHSGDVGVRKWSYTIEELLTGRKSDATAGQQVRDTTGRMQTVQAMDHFLTARGGWFFLAGQASIACQSVSNPKPERPQFWYPSRPPAMQPANPNPNVYGRGMGLVAQPLFATLGEDHLYAMLGPPPLAVINRNWGGNQEQAHNWLVAVGKKKGGRLGVESGSLLWSLEGDEKGGTEAFRRNTKKDQEWMSQVYFCSAPTYADGALYVLAVVDSGTTRESWAVCLDASNGLILWRTMICAASPAYFSSSLQPALGLPVAVQGGLVFCVTNLGTVAALEAATGRVRWIRVYDRVDQNNQGGWGMATAAQRDFWSYNPPILAEDRLIVTPQDSNYLYGLDPATGQLKWLTERVSSAGHIAPGDVESLQYVLGIAHGRLIVSGRNVYFIEIKGGRREARAPFIDDHRIVGRGVVTRDVILVPTEKALVRINATLTAKGRPNAKLMSEHPWEDAEAEAGNLIIAGDVLFSVSPTHVNAYFVAEEVERKLVARIKENPADLSAYLELGDIYHRIEKFDAAVKTFDEALGVVKKQGDTPDAANAAKDLRARKFEAFFSAGEKAMGGDKMPEAYAQFEKALASAEKEDQPVRALWKMAESALAQKKAAEAVMLYHRMLTEHGKVSYGFSDRSASLASIFAQKRIETIQKDNPDAVKQLEALAEADFAKAAGASEPAALEAVLERYPTTAVYGKALLALGKLYLAKGQGDASRRSLQRYLVKFGSGPATPEVLAHLALAYEKAGMIGAARGVLKKLTKKDDLAKATVTLPGEGAKVLGPWATARLALPLYEKPPSGARLDVGNGHDLKDVWKRTVRQAWPILPEGRQPDNMLRNTLMLEDNELAVCSGVSGEEIWKPRPRVPEGYSIRHNRAFDPNMGGAQGNSACWSDELLVLAGRNRVEAYDTRKKGALAWAYDLNPSTGAGGGAVVNVLPVDGRVVLTQAAGRLTVLDGATGKEVWFTQVEGGQMLPPTAGDGFLVVGLTGVTPQRVQLYEMETDLVRVSIDAPGGRLALPPVAAGERLYLVGADNRLRAYDGLTGKAIWELGLDAQPVHLYADHAGVMAVLNTLELVVCSPDAVAQEEVVRWKAGPHLQGRFAGLIADGSDVFLASTSGAKGEIVAYQAKSGKMSWMADTSGALLDADESLAKGHLLVRQKAFDSQNAQATMATLLDRKSGKRTWCQNFSTRQGGGLVLFDGGVAIVDGNQVLGSVVEDPDRARVELEALLAQVQKEPKNADLRMRLAQLYYERNDPAQAAKEMAQVLALDGLDEQVFQSAFERFSNYRKEAAKSQKRTIPFARLSKAPVVDGDLADWAKADGLRLDSWADIFLAGEDDRRKAFKRSDWNGPDDLSVTFWGGYDDKKLYLAAAVKDNVHKNPQELAGNLWNGDSMQFAFDMERDDKSRFLGNDFELGLAKNDKGQQLTWSWVVRSKFLMVALPEESIVCKVSRDEAAKTTNYEMAIALDYLSMKPEAGFKFGFTFVANDLDDEENVEKGMGPSPGIWNPKHPGHYAVGELMKAK